MKAPDRSALCSVLLLLLLTGAILAARQSPDATPFLSGYVYWDYGSPTTSLRVELRSQGRQLDESYTNTEGYYTLEVDGDANPCTGSDACTIRVALKDDVLASKSLDAVSPGTTVDTIFVSPLED